MKINEAVKEHELADSEWRFNELAREIHVWLDRFNNIFFEGKLPTPFLMIDKGPVRWLGHYRYGRNSVGAKFTININSLYLERPMQEILCTVLHEQTHLWQEIFGKPGFRYYHNKEYREKVASFGIHCDQQGRTIGVGEPFVNILNKYGVNAVEIPPEECRTVKKKGSSKLKRWFCGCQNARVAIPDFQAVCKKCGNDFKLVEEE